MVIDVLKVLNRARIQLDFGHIGSMNLAIEVEEAMRAVAEYVAANDEYDQAEHLRDVANAWLGPNAKNEASDRFLRAVLRRAAAHARMKGETK